MWCVVRARLSGPTSGTVRCGEVMSTREYWDPAHPVLEVDAILRDGDADGPLLLPVAAFKAMVGFEAAAACVPTFRDAGRTERHDGVEYVAFPLWRTTAP